MRSGGVGWMALVVLPALALPGRARACDINVPSQYRGDPTAVGVDQTPPQLAQPEVAELRHIDHSDDGCAGKCGWDWTAMLTNLATDDMTSVDRIGYRLKTVAGNEPPANVWLGGPIVGRMDGALELFWDGGGEFDFTLQVVALDGAGNESAPQTVRLHTESSGCSVSRGRAGLLDTFAFVVLALAALSLRASRPRACGTRRS